MPVPTEDYLSDLVEILSKSRSMIPTAMSSSNFASAVSKLIRKKHIRPSELRKILKTKELTNDISLGSIEHCSAVSFLWNTLTPQAKSEILTGFIYGSTARGEVDSAPHYWEDAHYASGRFIKSRFTIAPPEVGASDVDVALITKNPAVIEAQVRAAMEKTRAAYPQVPLTVKLFPEKQLQDHIDSPAPSVPRQILVFSEVIPFTGFGYLRGLRRRAFDHSDIRHSLINLEVRGELDRMVYGHLKDVLHTHGLSEFELSAADFKRLMPVEYAKRAEGIEYGSPRDFVTKLSLPPHIKLLRRVNRE